MNQLLLEVGSLVARFPSKAIIPAKLIPRFMLFPPEP
jgi:hypothetical protein